MCHSHRPILSGRLAAPLLALLLSSLTAHAASLPVDFAEELVAATLQNPTAMALAPDGRIFVCEKDGAVRVVKNGALLAAPFAVLAPATQGERGLLGIALDPAFPSNGFVYLYWTATSPTLHNKVTRFTAAGDLAAPGSEATLFDLDDLSGASNHNGGALHFGPDGKLYVAAGENANGSNAQTLGNVLGKILRLNKDGTIPNDNPFVNAATGKNRSIWALGLRNPYTFAFDPVTGRMFINDVGQNTWEEINDGLPGGNYGWPVTEGPHDNPAYQKPLFAYGHGNGGSTGCAIAGGAFYRPTTLSFPADYVGDYFFGDFCSGWIRRFDPQTQQVRDFAQGIGAPIDYFVAPDGSFYYLAHTAGTLYRVRYLGPPPPNNQPPVATIANPPNRALYSGGETFAFGGSAGDPEDGALPASALTWRIDFFHSGVSERVLGPVSGVAGGSFATATTGDTSTNAFYRIRLTARDSQGLESSSTVDLVPRLVSLTVQSAPSGLQVSLNGQSRITPYTAPAVVGVQQNLTPPTPQALNGVTYLFQGWGDDAPAPRIFPAPAVNTTYLAIYTSGDPPPPSSPVGLGLTGTYYNTVNLTRPAHVRIDPRVSFDFQELAPAPRVDPDTFSVRWTGQIRPKVSGRHTFTTLADDGVRLWINGVQLIDDWTEHLERESSGSIDLVEGALYDIRLEYFDGQGEALIQLFWSTPGLPREVIPAQRSYPYALLVAAPGTPNAADNAVLLQLRAAGFIPQVKPDNQLAAFDALGKGLVLVSSSVDPNRVNNKLRPSLVPLVVWEPGVFDDLALTGTQAGSFGTLLGQTRVRIVNPSHPLAAGFPAGGQTATASPSTFSFGLPNANAVIVGRSITGARPPVLFGYESGAGLFGLAAPSRRVGLFLGDGTAAALTPQGRALLDAAIRWAAGL
jgi:glucose/arabinose dehydrogenase